MSDLQMARQRTSLVFNGIMRTDLAIYTQQHDDTPRTQDELETQLDRIPYLSHPRLLKDYIKYCADCGNQPMMRYVVDNHHIEVSPDLLWNVAQSTRPHDVLRYLTANHGFQPQDLRQSSHSGDGRIGNVIERLERWMM